MNPIIKADKFLEVIGQEIRKSTTKYLRTSDRVLRTMTAVSCLLGESIMNNENWDLENNYSRGGVYIVWFGVSELYAAKKPKTNPGDEKTLNPNLTFLSLNRLCLFIWASTVIASGSRVDLLALFAYIAISFHDSDGKAIRGWIEKKINRYKPLSVKINSSFPLSPQQ